MSSASLVKALVVFRRNGAWIIVSVPSNGEVKMSTAIASFGDWDFLYANALLEHDPNRLKERITAAEAAINERLKALANYPHAPENEALLDALRALRGLQLRRSREANPISSGCES